MDVESYGSFGKLKNSIVPLDKEAAALAKVFHAQLTKPVGSLGRLEAIGAQLCGISGSVPPPPPTPASLAIFAGDHGVLDEGVTPWPAEVTTQMVDNFCSGGAAVNILADHAGIDVTVVDVGVASELKISSPSLRLEKVRAGTANLALEDAMSHSEAQKAMDVGAQVASDLVERGARCLIAGDMGIGNTTASSALIAAFTGTSTTLTTGRGTGIDEAMYRHKIGVVDRALARAGYGGVQGARAARSKPLAGLAALGGLEHAALVGFIVAGAALRIPVILDGVISASACVVASAFASSATDYCIAGHLSEEPGSAIALQYLGLEAILDLDLRLGEGSGACLAYPVVLAAARVMNEMATFDSVGIDAKPQL